MAKTLAEILENAYAQAQTKTIKELSKLISFQAHTSSDMRSNALGDIDINNPNGTCFELLEISTTNQLYHRYNAIYVLSLFRYSSWLQYEYERGGGIKKQHLQVWQTIC